MSDSLGQLLKTSLAEAMYQRKLLDGECYWETFNNGHTIFFCFICERQHDIFQGAPYGPNHRRVCHRCSIEAVNNAIQQRLNDAV